MSEYVWISEASIDSRNSRAFLPWVNGKHNMTEEHRESYGLNFKGTPLPSENFPKDVYAQKARRYHTMKPICIFKNGYWYVSRKCKDVLEQFDMGAGAFYLVRLWTPDGKSQLDQEYYHLNFGNVKNALLPDKSPNIEKFTDGTERWSAPMYASREDQVIFSKDALEGADIWVDTRIPSRFLISNRLKHALDNAKLSTEFRLYRCPIVEG